MARKPRPNPSSKAGDWCLTSAVSQLHIISTDRMELLGVQSEKTISRYVRDEKIPMPLDIGGRQPAGWDFPLRLQ
jgi:hypothetical protein